MRRAFMHLVLLTLSAQTPKCTTATLTTLNTITAPSHACYATVGRVGGAAGPEMLFVGVPAATASGFWGG